MTLKDLRVVLLDEPTTGLDQFHEQQALAGLAQWIGDRTLIMVTHRPQVLQLVERIVVIDNGKVVLDGPRDAVLKRLAGKSDELNQEVSLSEQPAKS